MSSWKSGDCLLRTWRTPDWLRGGRCGRRGDRGWHDWGRRGKWWWWGRALVFTSTPRPSATVPGERSQRDVTCNTLHNSEHLSCTTYLISCSNVPLVALVWMPWPAALSTTAVSPVRSPLLSFAVSPTPLLHIEWLLAPISTIHRRVFSRWISRQQDVYISDK